MLGVKVGSFTKQSSTGTQAITGVGFQPKLLLFIGASTATATDGSFSSGYRLHFGAGTDQATDRGLSIHSDHNADPSDCRSALRGFVWHDHQEDGTLNQTCALVSLDSDGFTVNWTANDATAYRICYIALGGDHFVDTRVSNFIMPSSPGTWDFTFEQGGGTPDLLLLIGTGHLTSPSSVSNIGSFCFGMAKQSPIEQGVIASCIKDGASPTRTARYQRTDKCLALFSVTDPAVLTHEAELVSMDGPVVRLRFTKADVSNKRVIAIRILGGHYTIGSFTAPTSGTPPVVQTLTDAQVSASSTRGILFLSVGAEPSEEIELTAKHSIGAADANGSEFSCWSADRDNISQAASASTTNTFSHVIQHSTEDPITENTTTEAQADFISFGEQSITVSWIKRDWTAREVLYLTFSDTLGEEAAARVYSKVGNYFTYTLSSSGGSALMHGIHTTFRT